MIIGVTGASGAGKSTITKILKPILSAEVIDADKIVKELEINNENYIKDIENKFGQAIINEDGTLNRLALSKIIYEDDKNRQKLNDTTFPYITKKIEEKIQYFNNKRNIILDIPLLFESKLDKKCDKIVGVLANQKIKIQRICKRDNITQEYAKKRIEIQNTDEFFIRNCDEIINNNGTIEEVIKQIRKWEWLTTN